MADAPACPAKLGQQGGLAVVFYQGLADAVFQAAAGEPEGDAGAVRFLGKAYQPDNQH